MTQSPGSKKIPMSIALAFAIGSIAIVVSCSSDTEDPAITAEKKAAAESDCRQLASARSGYNAGASSGGSSVGKSAAIGAVGGAAIGAVTSSKSKKVVQGAAVGAVAGAGVGALKDKKEKEKAEQAAAVYRAEYNECMSSKGF